jgi:hypothetical protein
MFLHFKGYDDVRDLNNTLPSLGSVTKENVLSSTAFLIWMAT